MTVQDEARDLIRQLCAAEDELSAARLAIDQRLGSAYGCIFVDTADGLAARLRAAQGRVAEIRAALAAINAEVRT